MKAGFLGLGRLGKAMAQRLLAEGVDLIVWNRTRKKARDLTQAELAASPAGVICEAPVIFLNLLDSAAVHSVMTGPAGLLEGDCPGKIVVDTTTHHFSAVQQFYTLAEERGFAYLEAPVSGSVGAALAGKLTAYVSGDRRAFEQALPYLQKLASHVQFLGQAQLASRVKLINNAVLGAFMATLAEAIAMGERAGLTREQMIEALAAGAGNSGVLNAKGDKLLRSDYSPHFPVSLLYRDLGFAQDLARDEQRPFFLPGLAKELYALALSSGLAEQDFSVIYQVIKGWGD